MTRKILRKQYDVGSTGRGIQDPRCAPFLSTALGVKSQTNDAKDLKKKSGSDEGLHVGLTGRGILDPGCAPFLFAALGVKSRTKDMKDLTPEI